MKIKGNHILIGALVLMLAGIIALLLIVRDLKKSPAINTGSELLLHENDVLKSERDSIQLIIKSLEAENKKIQSRKAVIQNKKSEAITTYENELEKWRTLPSTAVDERIEYLTRELNKNDSLPGR